MKTAAQKAKPAKGPSQVRCNHPELQSMLLKHSSMVKVIVAKMRDRLPSHADLEELESVGLLGLIDAVERFDPSRGYSFETYASIRIRGAILDELRSMDLLPRSVRAKQRKLNETVQTLEQRHGRAPTDEEIRSELQLTPKKYGKLCAQTQTPSFIFLDRQQSSEEVNPHDSIADELQIPSSSALEHRELCQIVARRIKALPEQQRKVLAMYYYEDMRLAEIGQVMGLTEARISQIRAQAILDLRRYLTKITKAA